MASMRLNTTHQWWTKSRHWTHMFLVNLFSACILQVEWFDLKVNSPHFKSAWMSKGHLSTWTCIGKRKTKAMVCPMIHCFPIVFQNSWLCTFFLASHWGFFGKSMAALLHPAAKAGVQQKLWWAKALEALGRWSGFKADDCGSEQVCENVCTLRTGNYRRLAGSREANMAYTWNKF